MGRPWYISEMKSLPVELVQVQSTGEVRRQYKRVANALQGSLLILLLLLSVK